MIEKIHNFISKSYEFIKTKILIFIFYILDIFQKNVSGFFQFLFERNIIFTAIGILVSTQISKLISTFFIIFIDPIIKRLSNGKINNLKKIEVEIYNTNFKIGIFIDAIINFILTFIIIYSIFSLSKNKNYIEIFNWLRNAKNQINETVKDKINIVKVKAV